VHFRPSRSTRPATIIVTSRLRLRLWRSRNRHDYDTLRTRKLRPLSHGGFATGPGCYLLSSSPRSQRSRWNGLDIGTALTVSTRDQTSPLFSGCSRDPNPSISVSQIIATSPVCSPPGQPTIFTLRQSLGPATPAHFDVSQTMAPGSPQTISLSGTTTPASLWGTVQGISNTASVTAGQSAAISIAIECLCQRYRGSVCLTCQRCPSRRDVAQEVPASVVCIAKGVPAPFTYTVTTSGSAVLPQSVPRRVRSSCWNSLPLVWRSLWSC